VIIPPHLAHLPPPSAAAQALSDQLTQRIVDEIGAQGGWLSHARFMELALYAPGLGYYSAGSRKLGDAGDFVTAPELSPLFTQTLARQIAEMLARGLDEILEVGAGTGSLAVELLSALERAGVAPNRYLILELSAELKARQRARLEAAGPTLANRVTWIDAPPPHWSGIVLGNEVLDAMPVHVVRQRGGVIEVAGIERRQDETGLVRAYRPATGEVLASAQQLTLADDYETELPLAAGAFMHTVGASLERGYALFIDYGFPAREFYHPHRSSGTLMCHYRHHAHPDALSMIGLQDITAHVDFSRIAQSAAAEGMALLGYTTQAQFLINCGITEILSRTPAEDVKAYAPLAAAAQMLLSPAEMGELFKAIAFGKTMGGPLMGFTQGDRSHTL
jgi:SAM-dependent MidA family methyltransferase